MQNFPPVLQKKKKNRIWNYFFTLVFFFSVFHHVTGLDSIMHASNFLADFVYRDLEILFIQSWVD